MLDGRLESFKGTDQIKASQMFTGTKLSNHQAARARRFLRSTTTLIVLTALLSSPHSFCNSRIASFLLPLSHSIYHISAFTMAPSAPVYVVSAVRTPVGMFLG